MKASYPRRLKRYRAPELAGGNRLTYLPLLNPKEKHKVYNFYDLLRALLDTPSSILIILVGVVIILCGTLRSVAPLMALVGTALLVVVLSALLAAVVNDGWAFLGWMVLAAIPCLGAFIALCVFFQHMTILCIDQRKAIAAIVLGTAMAFSGLIFAFYNYHD